MGQHLQCHNLCPSLYTLVPELALLSTMLGWRQPVFPSSWGPGTATFPAAHGTGTLLHPLLSGSACASLNHMLVLSSVGACYCKEKSFGLC